MSTPRPLECKCGHKEDEHSIVRDRYCVMAGCPCMCFEGVAAPLEPTQIDELIGKMFPHLTGKTVPEEAAAEQARMKLKLFAAAVSKNLQQQLDQANFSKKMWHDLSKEWEEICRQYPARILELEKEIAALRETK